MNDHMIQMMSLYLSGGVHMRHEEMTSSFVQHDVGKFSSLYQFILVYTLEAVGCVEVFAELSHHDVGCHRVMEWNSI